MSFVYDPEYGCLLATGRADRDGYVFHGRTRAHIAAWESVHGSVPPDRELDHTCRRRACCAVDANHLEPVTRSENERRKSWRYRAKIPRCPAGHLLAQTGIITPQGGRVCRTCRDAAKERA